MTLFTDVTARLQALKRAIALAHAKRDYRLRNKLCSEHDRLVLEAWDRNGQSSTKQAAG